jgi:hypothetical protein
MVPYGPDDEQEMQQIWDYYYWLLNIVYVEPDGPLNRLCWALFNTEFQWNIPMDHNRAGDGLALRSRFDDGILTNNLLPKWCSALEMMVALSDRIETEIMSCDTFGDRTGLWFRIMLHFLHQEIDGCDSFLSFCDSFQNKSITKAFEKNSDFRLFLSKKWPKSLHKVEIWYQMHAFLLENYGF